MSEGEWPVALEKIVEHMRTQLKGADLNILTFRQVMTSLETHFKIELVPRKKELRKILDTLIQEQADEDNSIAAPPIPSSKPHVAPIQSRPRKNQSKTKGGEGGKPSKRTKHE
eukprot:CAMPEP_0184337304 /NCGR_PEP_ID=MMETSP1089-20130417/5694_1 /TAXON_ID=38269 ORGANISM="Gloeochaete wittrockiana, Strain SAG46.84" /NCGR_SAMPLE_ID=MMETSP1089 /ASSEMBLY_ACC=CAM_ASM_000445 /LENGTH=112 /DNA_ID=CAMNT_0026662933 /DNA_START=56 /DNA_END=391 /DNA_ORIENTATION=-